MASRGQSVTLQYVAWDTANNAGKTGDNANHTLRWVKDGTSAALDGSPTISEVDATNAPGLYKVTLSATDCTCNVGTLCGKSSTSGIVIIPVTIPFELLPTALDANGWVKADVEDWRGSQPNALQSGRVDAYVGAVAAGVIAAASFAANALDAVWSTAARTLTAFAFTPSLDAAYDAAKTAAQAGDAMALTGGERTTLAGVIWNSLTSGMSTVGSIGKKLADWVLGTDSKVLVSTDAQDLSAALDVRTKVISNGAITAAAIATDAIDADALAADALAEIAAILLVTPANKLATDATGYVTATNGGSVSAADIRAAVGLASANLDTQLDALPTAAENATALLDLTDGVETDLTPRQALRAMLADLVGKAAESSGTVVFKRKDGTTTALTVVHDTTGNRTTVTYGDLT